MKHSPSDEATHVAVIALQQWEDDVDGVLRARLAAARRLALSPAAGAASWRAPMAWGGAIATSLALIVGIGLWSQHRAAGDDGALLQATLEESALGGIDAHDAELLLDDDLDLYLWLDSGSGPT